MSNLNMLQENEKQSMYNQHQRKHSGKDMQLGKNQVSTGFATKKINCEFDSPRRSVLTTYKTWDFSICNLLSFDSFDMCINCVKIGGNLYVN